MSDSRLQRLGARIDAMSLRERAMLAAILLLLLWAGWQLLLMAPLLEQRKQLAERTEQARTTVATLNQSIQMLAAERSRDPLAELRLQLEMLQRERGSLDAQLAEATRSLIDPQQMGAVLEAILAKQQGLQLRAIGSLPAEPINPQGAAGLPPIWRHGLRVEVEGDYLGLLRFVQAIDALPWDFVWSDLELKVEAGQPPRLHLTLHTLSLKAGWLGV